MNETARENDKTLSDGDNSRIFRAEDMPDELKHSIQALEDKKIEDIRIFDLREFTPYCDFVVLGTSHSPAQSKVAREEVVKALSDHGIRLYGQEGDDDSGWLLLDFWDIVIHLFRSETRNYYNLEALWADFPSWP